ncbi:MAG: preprotein translocase subunit SecG [Clostridia bacterium]|nr:preprotein translocase subunit SecG [Clostridia bacterium]
MFNFVNLICADEQTGVADWIVKSFPIIEIVIMCLLLVLSIAMIILTIMQKSNTNGVSAISGQSDTFYNRNKGATLQGKVKTLTIITAVLIFVLVIVFLVLSRIYRPW